MTAQTATKTLNLDELLTFKDEVWDTDATFSAGHWDTPMLTMPYEGFSGAALTRRYSVFGWDADSRQRMVQDGPKVQGPVAYLQSKPDVITAHRQAPVTEIPVSVGDHLIIRCTEYVIGCAGVDILLDRVQ